MQRAAGLVKLVFINSAYLLIAFKISLFKVSNWSFRSSTEYTKDTGNTLKSWTYFPSSKFIKFLMYLYLVSNLLTGMFAMIEDASWSLILGHGNTFQWRILFAEMLEMIWSVSFFAIRVAFKDFNVSFLYFSWCKSANIAVSSYHDSCVTRRFYYWQYGV